MDVPESSKVFVFYLKGEPSPFKVNDYKQALGDSICNSTEDIIQEKFLIHPNLSPEKKELVCRCLKSRCLRLKCSCFVEGRVCGPKCECLNCLNSVSNQALREAAANLNKKIFNNPFRKAQVHEINGKRVLDSGCRCKLSGCRNNYCQCVRNGAVCSELCACRVCDHEKVQIELKLSEKLPQKNRRKRLRLVIKTPSTGHEQQVLPQDYLLLEKI